MNTGSHVARAEVLGSATAGFLILILHKKHANLEGYDHTAVAKPGIDRLMQEARKEGRTAVYFVSKEYPNWYTADRRPDYAIIREGQEHKIRSSRSFRLDVDLTALRAILWQLMHNWFTIYR